MLGNANFLMKFKKMSGFSVTRMHIRRPRNKLIKMIFQLFVQKLAKPIIKLNNALKQILQGQFFANLNLRAS